MSGLGELSGHLRERARGLARRALLAGGSGLAMALGLGRKGLAQLQVEVGRGRVEPVPIAVSPMAGDRPDTTDLGVAIADVVAADLDSSGLFKTIDRDAYIQSPEELRDLPRFADWRQINAQGLVTGTVTSGATGPIVEFRLWDVFAGTQLTGLRFEGPQALWRRLAHKTADAIYTRLTGEGAYFDTRIAYIGESGPGNRRIKRLAMMDQDGAGNSFLTDGRHLVLTPRISPDTRELAYLAYRDIVPRVFIRDLAAGRETAITEIEGMTFSPRFSPDGTTLLVTAARDGNSDLWAYERASRRVRRLTDGSAIDTSPSFSPDGRRIAFNSDRAGGPQLYVMGASGGAAQRISFGSGRYGDPAWSPRGDLIAFTKIQGGFFHIGLIRPDGSDERLLTRSFLDEGPSWAPNGRVILFSRLDRGQGRTRLFSIDITGYNERVVATPLDASDPDWSALLP